MQKKKMIQSKEKLDKKNGNGNNGEVQILLAKRLYYAWFFKLDSSVPYHLLLFCLIHQHSHEGAQILRLFKAF